VVYQALLRRCRDESAPLGAPSNPRYRRAFWGAIYRYACSPWSDSSNPTSSSAALTVTGVMR
jgi:hypothetical protein